MTPRPCDLCGYVNRRVSSLGPLDHRDDGIPVFTLVMPCEECGWRNVLVQLIGVERYAFGMSLYAQAYTTQLAVLRRAAA